MSNDIETKSGGLVSPEQGSESLPASIGDEEIEQIALGMVDSHRDLDEGVIYKTLFELSELANGNFDRVDRDIVDGYQGWEKKDFEKLIGKIKELMGAESKKAGNETEIGENAAKTEPEITDRARGIIEEHRTLPPDSLDKTISEIILVANGQIKDKDIQKIYNDWRPDDLRRLAKQIEQIRIEDLTDQIKK